MVRSLSLLTVLCLGVAWAAPDPAPSDDADDGELILDDDDDTDAQDVPPPPPPAKTDDTSAKDSAAADTKPSTRTSTIHEPRPGTFSTEGSAKAPPPDAALERDNPLERPDRTRRDRAGRPGSPQRFELEFKMGPYLPDIDRDYSGPGLGPFASVFGVTDDAGNATRPPRPAAMPIIGFEWQFLYLAGPLGIGTQFGFFRDKAQALVTDPIDPNNLRSAADETRFAMIPLALLLTYRFELLADRLKVPLVPYAKAGLGYALYWTKSGSGNLSRNSRGDIGRGGVPGWQLNAGGMLRLDFIEPGTAKRLDQLTGINHTYIFGEYQLALIANFGSDSAIALGDGTWFAGLAIEF